MTSLLGTILLILAASALILVVCHRLRVPPVIGLLLAGALLGPHGAGLVRAAEEVEFLAELGVVLLLFTIGLEFPLQDLWRLRRVALGGGGLQVVLTVLLGLGVWMGAGRPLEEGIFAGFFLALSSTAIVLKTIQDRGESGTPYGRAATGILLVQDLAVVPMLLLVPVLAGTQAVRVSLGTQLLTSVGLVAVVVASRWVVPWVMGQVIRTRDREVFALSVVVVGLAVAWLTHAAHLSLALGAFFAGVIMAESEYSHDAMGIVLPFRHVFASIFFFSVGMLLDLEFVLEKFPLIAGAALVVVLAKALLTAIGLRIAREPPRTAAHAGLALAQVGEFSFVLLQSGFETRLIGDEAYQMFLAVAVLTLGLTPFLIGWAPPLARRALRLTPTPDLDLKSVPAGIRDHLVVIGAGLGGRQVARAAKSCGIPYVILDMNYERVKSMRRDGEPARFGDAVHEPSLRAVALNRARVLVLTIPDAVSTRRILGLARKLNPAIHIIVRTRYVAELPTLQQLGANQVVSEEFETSIEIFTRVLAAYMIPDQDIASVAAEIRAEGYQMLRAPGAWSDFGAPATLPGIEVKAYRVEPGSLGADRTAAELDLRRRRGVTLLAVRRGEDTLANPSSDERIREGDVVVLLGSVEQLAEAASVFSAPEAVSPSGPN